MKLDLTGCIVLYQNDREVLLMAINSFLGTDLNLKLYLIDNSPTDELNDVCFDTRISYFHNPSNPGFGAAHNIAIKDAIKLGSKYHVVINPDIYFSGDICKTMICYMNINEDIGMMMPKVLNEDGTIQSLPKLLPSPLSIIWRKLKRPVNSYNKFIEKYELRFVPSDIIYNAPILSGCFTLLNLNAIKEIGMYDDRYFMYFEDWDLSRRMHAKYRTIYFPQVSVYHKYESGANKSGKLFKIFIKSAIAYFNKWGWLFDKERQRINRSALAQFR
ncbi:glycosyltransferase [Pedobacter kyonggii]|uniref:Glycosyltransferase n=1 Tax=Pedobacter kyonggii TaxID=1926871 RepID=A0A4Q9HFF8_9SPHI|nr:glycosyltransferase [Pedobacter kyonggii]TBO43311.1 glycosyltransferase [Pedobacter kyonggii]